ncbi:MAG: beta strand repeat-containing protein [Elusimicrobiota bacterium]
MACAALLLLPALVSRSFADAGTVSIVSAVPATGVAGSSNTVVISGQSTLSPVTVSVGASYFMPTLAGSAWAVRFNTVGLANGQYQITAKAPDGSGHTVSASKYLIVANGPTGRSFTLSGTSVPTLTTPAAATAKSVAATATVSPTVGITAPAANATVSGSYRVYGTAAETGGTVASVSVSVDGGAAAAATGTTSWSYTLNTTLHVNGAHTISVTAKDSAGHVSAAKSVTFKTSNIPTVAISAPALNATVSGSVNVTGTSAETGGTVQSVSVSVDGDAYASASGTTNWSFALNTTKLANGTHTIYVKSVDFGGNASAIQSRTITVRNALPVPTVAITAPAANATVSGSVGVAGTAAETGGSIKSVEISVNGGAYVAATGAASWSYALNTGPLKNGAISFSVKALDASGTSSAIQSRAITVHNVPTVTIASPASGATIHGTASSITGTAAVETGGVLKSVLVSVDGGAAATAAGTASWSYALSLKPGSHTISVTATDTSGNSSAAKSVTVSVVVAPTAAITAPAGGATVSGAAKVAGTAAEVGGTIASVSVSVDGGAYASASGTTNWSFLLSSSLSSGQHTVTAKVTDAAGGSYTTPALTFTAENNVPVSGVMTVSGSNKCTTYTASSCNPGAAWSGSAKICDTKGLGICGTVSASGTGSQSVSASVSLAKSGATLGQTTVTGQVSANGSTSCTQYDDPTTTCVTDPIYVCEPECVWEDETCYDDDGNPYDCGYYDCSVEDCYWDYSNQTCTTTDNYYYQCTEKVSGSGTLTGTLQ